MKVNYRRQITRQHPFRSNTVTVRIGLHFETKTFSPPLGLAGAFDPLKSYSTPSMHNLVALSYHVGGVSKGPEKDSGPWSRFMQRIVSLKRPVLY